MTQSSTPDILPFDIKTLIQVYEDFLIRISTRTPNRKTSFVLQETSFTFSSIINYARLSFFCKGPGKHIWLSITHTSVKYLVFVSIPNTIRDLANAYVKAS